MLLLVFVTKWRVSGSRATSRGSSNAEIIEIKHRVPQQRKTAVGFVTPHRVVSKHHDVPLAHRNVDDRSFSGEFGTAGQHAADKQFFFRSEPQDNARSGFGARLQRQ